MPNVVWPRRNFSVDWNLEMVAAWWSSRDDSLELPLSMLEKDERKKEMEKREGEEKGTNGVAGLIIWILLYGNFKFAVGNLCMRLIHTSKGFLAIETSCVLHESCTK